MRKASVIIAAMLTLFLSSGCCMLAVSPNPSAGATSALTPVPATQTPASQPVATLLPGSALTSTTYGLPIPGKAVNHLAMDDKYLYWTTEGGSDLFRYPMDSSTGTAPAVIASTRFDQGTLDAYPNDPLAWAGVWLMFDDRQIQTKRWALRALNVETQTELTVAQGDGSTLLDTFSSDGEWAAWIAKDLATGAAILTAQNLATGQNRELARSASPSSGWEQVVVSAGQAGGVQAGNAGRTLFLFDLKSGQGRTLLSEPGGSDMFGLAFVGNWMAWKTGTNSYGPTALYNLENARIERLPDLGVTPVLVGHWLAWEAAYEQPLYVVDLESLQSFQVAEAQPGEDLQSVAIHGPWLAWSRVHSNSDRTKVVSRLEWRALP